jgi:hypothetical protein
MRKWEDISMGSSGRSVASRTVSRCESTRVTRLSTAEYGSHIRPTAVPSPEVQPMTTVAEEASSFILATRRSHMQSRCSVRRRISPGIVRYDDLVPSTARRPGSPARQLPIDSYGHPRMLRTAGQGLHDHTSTSLKLANTDSTAYAPFLRGLFSNAAVRLCSR